METPDRYWSGVYWDGLNPEDIGAVELSGADSEDVLIDGILNSCRSRLKGQQEVIEEYFVTLIELDEIHKQAEEAASSSSAAVAASSTPATAASSSSPSASSTDCDGRCIIVRLWHEAVILGARETADANPGEKCRDWHYARDDGRFLHERTLEQTDAMLQQAEAALEALQVTPAVQ